MGTACRSAAAFCLVTLCMSPLPARCGDGEDFFAPGRLLEYIKQDRLREAEELLFTQTFDGWTLGRALLHALSLRDSSRDGERRAFRLAQLLVAKGADVDYTDPSGRTPLMESCAKRFETVAHLLLSSGASLDAVDDAGRDAWDHAATAGGDTAMITWLLDKARESRLPPAASNVRVRLRNSHVEILYDLSGTHPAQVELRATSGADGSSIPVRSVSGDIGTLVPPGRDRKIVWSLAEDRPRKLGRGGVEIEVVVLEP